MVAKFDQTDSSVVVIIGTGAGGGVLANELAQKGVKVVALEAGGRYLPEDYVNDEWESFGQLAWLDPRTTSGDWRVAKDFSGLPAWIVKAVGGTTTDWAGASLRFQDHEWKALTTYGRVDGANLLDWPIDGAEMAPWYDKAETKLGVTRTGDRPGLPGNNNYKVLEKGALAIGYKEVHTGRMAINSLDYDNRMACQQTGFCFQGCKWGAKWSAAYTEIPAGEATGNLEGVSYEEIRYEGYGIGGAAIIVDCMTDNRVRTVAEVRHAFSKYGGNMGTEGSVAFQFKHCGQMIFAPGTSEDKVMEVALDAGAEDVIADEDGAIEVLTAYADFEKVKNALEAAGLKPEVAEVTMRPESTIELTGSQAVSMQKLIDMIEEIDDVQNVFHNASIEQ